jgi:hypothetical protein
LTAKHENFSGCTVYGISPIWHCPPLSGVEASDKNRSY